MNTLKIWVIVFTSVLAWTLAKENLKCWSHAECGPKQCCAGMSDKRAGICRHQPQSKEPCDPFLWPGASRCPCRVGLTCQPVIPTNETQGVTGRCVYVAIDTDEVEERRELFETEN